MENSYLRRLGLAPGASQADVKRAYRALSKRYHPDVNDDPNAEEQFEAIHEAYKFLTEVGPAPHRETVSYDYDPATDEFERKRREARAYAQRQRQEVERRRVATSRRLLYWFNFAAVAILLFNVVLLIDYYLPKQYHDEEIKRITAGYENRRTNSVYRYDDIYFENFHMRLDQGEVMNLTHYDQAIVETTSLLQTPLTVAITVDGVTTTHVQIYGLYRIFIYIIPATFVVAIIYALVPMSVDSKIGFAILLAMMAVFQLVLLFIR